MSNDKKPKKHRHSRGFTLLFISDDSDRSTTSMKFGPVGASLLAFGSFILVVLVVCLILYSVLMIRGLNSVIEMQNREIASVVKEKQRVQDENAAIKAMNDQLSKSINSKVVKENNAEKAEAAKHMPTGFPLTGAATLANTVDLKEADTIEEAIRILAERQASDEEVVQEGDPILYFTDASYGSIVVAAGDGVVEDIAEDSKYGNRIVIDHQNGYESIYRNAGDAMVKVGDEVSRGSMLYIIADNTTVGYQIKENGEFIDPETLTTIDG